MQPAGEIETVPEVAARGSALGVVREIVVPC